MQVICHSIQKDLWEHNGNPKTVCNGDMAYVAQRKQQKLKR